MPLRKIVSIFSVHTWFWGDVNLRNRGPELGRRISPDRSTLNRGVRATLHQDTPITPPDLLLTIWAVMKPISCTGQSILPEERISTWEALRAVTCEAVCSYSEEEPKEQIREGMKAVLFFLSADPLGTEPRDVREIEVITIVKDGSAVYRA